jgi:CheY-like chemotaxis protein
MRDLPVVAVSANAMPADRERAAAAGFADYVTKPVDLVQLLAVVETQLSR